MKKELKKLHSSISVFSFGKDKTKNQMKINKKVLVLGLVLLSLIVVNMVLIAAQDTTTDTTPNESFFRRWLNSTLTDIDAKMLLFIMVGVMMYILFFSLTGKHYYAAPLSIVITFVLTVYVTPASVLGVLKTYNTLPLLVTSLLPILILGSFSYLAASKNKKNLIIAQHTIWWIFFGYLILRLIAIGITYANLDDNLNFTETDPFYIAIHSFATMPTPDQATSFWIAYITQFVITIIMCFKNGSMIGIISNSAEETDEAIANRNVKEIVAGAKELKTVHKGISNMPG